MQVIDELSNLQVEEEQLHNLEVDNENQTPQFDSKIANHNIIQLSKKLIPKGLIPLEKLFYNDVPKNPLLDSLEENIEIYNIGSSEEIRNLKIYTSLSMEAKDKYLALLKSYKDVFCLSYNGLKRYGISLIEHKIPLKPEEKPFKQKLRRIFLVVLPVIEKELKKLLNTKIILPLRYPEWVANLVPVRKNNGEIRLCVDFRNLNKSSLKDNYPLPKMD